MKEPETIAFFQNLPFIGYTVITCYYALAGKASDLEKKWDLSKETLMIFGFHPELDTDGETTVWVQPNAKKYNSIHELMQDLDDDVKAAIKEMGFQDFEMKRVINKSNPLTEDQRKFLEKYSLTIKVENGFEKLVERKFKLIEKDDKIEIKCTNENSKSKYTLGIRFSIGKVGANGRRILTKGNILFDLLIKLMLTLERT